MNGEIILYSRNMLVSEHPTTGVQKKSPFLNGGLCERVVEVGDF
jgi:hypothetical protein